MKQFPGFTEKSLRLDYCISMIQQQLTKVFPEIKDIENKFMDTKELEGLPKQDGEIEKGKAHITVELIEYEHNEVVSKSIMKKTTGSVNAMSFDTGTGLNNKTSPFDTYLQIIDGSAIIVVDGRASKLDVGQGILIPAHATSHVEPNGRFKLLLTVIKSGYE